jgi:hypothetical protein
MLKVLNWRFWRALDTVNLDPRPTWLIEILLNDKAVPGSLNRKFGEVFGLFWKNGYRCKVIDDERGSISETNVQEWMANGKIEGDKSNFMFFAE